MARFFELGKVSLPTYYFGLDSVSTRNFTYSGSRQRSRGMLKIPFRDPPTESEDMFNFSLDITGINPNDVAVVISGNDLVIEIEREFDPHKVCHTDWEKQFGIFTRHLEIPDEVDPKKISFHFYEDELRFTLLKKGFAAEEAPKKDEFILPPEPQPETHL